MGLRWEGNQVRWLHRVGERAEGETESDVSTTNTTITSHHLIATPDNDRAE